MIAKIKAFQFKTFQIFFLGAFCLFAKQLQASPLDHVTSMLELVEAVKVWEDTLVEDREGSDSVRRKLYRLLDRCYDDTTVSCSEAAALVLRATPLGSAQTGYEIVRKFEKRNSSVNVVDELYRSLYSGSDPAKVAEQVAARRWLLGILERERAEGSDSVRWAQGILSKPGVIEVLRGELQAAISDERGAIPVNTCPILIEKKALSALLQRKCENLKQHQD